MIDWLSEAAGLFKTKDYIITGQRVLSFRDLNERVSYQAYNLHKNYKVKKGDISAIISVNNIDFLILLFALWRLGAIPVPINIRLNDSETDDLIRFLKPSFIFRGDDNKSIADQGSTIIRIGVDYSVPDNIATQENVIIQDNFKTSDANDTALILFTSGTSGNPKGVQLSFRNLKASFENSNTVLNHQPGDKWISSLPFYHIGGFSIITRALLSGTSIIIPASSKTEDLADSIIGYKPTFLSLVSTQLKRLINMGIKPGIELRCVLLGGGYIEDILVEEAIQERWPISKVYGSTETSSLISFLDCIKDDNKKSSGGKPLADNQIFIVNESKELLPNNKIGEIAIKSESCAKGYYNNPNETDKKFSRGIYYTGDSGYIDEDGYLFIESRIDDLIISGGENINPLEIEAALLEFPGIQNAAVFGIEDDEWGYIVSAAIITQPGFNISETELKKLLLNKISPFKVPRKYYFLNEFPVSPLGKVQKNKLRQIVKNY
jgi:O-succinylbenzoic acid--CoA ligase